MHNIGPYPVTLVCCPSGPSVLSKALLDSSDLLQTLLCDPSEIPQIEEPDVGSHFANSKIYVP